MRGFGMALPLAGLVCFLGACAGNVSHVESDASSKADHLGSFDAVYERETHWGDSIQGSGSLSARFVIAAIEDDIVEEWLPSGLELGSNHPGTSADTHPVIFLFGHHSDVTPAIAGVRGPLGLDYHEFITIVPSVEYVDARRSGFAGPYSYLARLYVDHLGAILLNIPYGFEKYSGDFRADGDEYSVIPDGVHAAIRAEFTVVGSFDAPERSRYWEVVSGIFTQPIISEAPLGYRCSIFDWDLDHARVRMIESNVEIVDDYLPGLAGFRAESRSLDDTPLGSFEMDVDWALSLPIPCGRLRTW